MNIEFYPILLPNLLNAWVTKSTKENNGTEMNTLRAPLEVQGKNKSNITHLARNKTPEPTKTELEAPSELLKEAEQIELIKENMPPPDFLPLIPVPPNETEYSQFYDIQDEAVPMEIEQTNTVMKMVSFFENIPKKGVTFRDTVDYRQTRGSTAGNGKYEVNIEQRSDLPLVNESGEPSKSDSSLEDATRYLEEKKGQITEWKKWPAASRPRGKASMGKRKNSNLTEKAITGRKESTIKNMYQTPSWQENLGWLEEQAKDALTEAGQAINTASLLFQMIYEANKKKPEANVTLAELKDLYVSIYLDTILSKQATGENPLPLKDLMARLALTKKDFLYNLKFGLAVNAIRKNANGTFILKYERVSIDEIQAHIKTLHLPDD